jgi:hypothetical protein
VYADCGVALLTLREQIIFLRFELGVGKHARLVDELRVIRN